MCACRPPQCQGTATALSICAGTPPEASSDMTPSPSHPTRRLGNPAGPVSGRSHSGPVDPPNSGLAPCRASHNGTSVSKPSGRLVCQQLSSRPGSDRAPRRAAAACSQQPVRWQPAPPGVTREAGGGQSFPTRALSSGGVTPFPVLSPLLSHCQFLQEAVYTFHYDFSDTPDVVVERGLKYGEVDDDSTYRSRRKNLPGKAASVAFWKNE